MPRETGLGGDQHALAPAVLGDGPADQLLGSAEAISRRGVDQRDAHIECRADRLDGLGLVAATPHPATDRPGAEPDARARHPDAPDQLLLHRADLLSL